MAVVCVLTCSTSFALLTSALTKMALVLCWRWMRSTVSCPACSLTSTMTRPAAPSLANSSAVSRPMPAEPPVMAATSPDSRGGRDEDAEEEEEEEEEANERRRLLLQESIG